METKGGEWYIAMSAAAFKAGNLTKAMLHLGCFAHGMEDRSSPYHAFGGYEAQRTKYVLGNTFVNTRNAACGAADREKAAERLSERAVV